MNKVFLVLFLFSSSLALSQDKEAISKALESTPNMAVSGDLLPFHKETQNGFSVYLNSTLDQAEKQWKQYLEQTYQAEVKKSKGGYVCENVSMKDISAGNLTVSAFFKEDELGCKMNAFYFTNGAYLNDKENKKETAAIKLSLMNYQKKLYVVTYEKVIDEERKVHEDETKALEKLEKEGEKLDKDATNKEEEITKAEEDIADAEKEISSLQAKIKALQGEIQASHTAKAALKEEKAKKAKEIVNQKSVVAQKASRIERLKSSADKINN